MAFKFENGIVTDLGALAPRKTNCSDAVSINARGEIVGTSEIDRIDPVAGIKELRGVLWKDGELVNLGTLGGNFTIATGINNSTQVVGASTNKVPDPFGLVTQTRAFLWEHGVMQDLGTLGSGNDSFAEFVNERGQVEGFSFTDSTVNRSTGLPTGHPFLWTNGKMQDLGSLGGTLAGCGCLNQQGGLNNRGEVVGLSNLPGDQTADPFLWDGEQLIDLFTSSAGGNPVTASAINDDGEVVGAAIFPNMPFVQAYLWKKGVAVDLGAVDDDCVSLAFAMNSREQIVGQSIPCAVNFLRSFLWENGSMIDLNTLISPNTLQLIDTLSIKMIVGRLAVTEPRPVAWTTLRAGTLSC